MTLQVAKYPLLLRNPIPRKARMTTHMAEKRQLGSPQLFYFPFEYLIIVCLNLDLEASWQWTCGGIEWKRPLVRWRNCAKQAQNVYPQPSPNTCLFTMNSFPGITKDATPLEAAAVLQVRAEELRRQIVKLKESNSIMLEEDPHLLDVDFRSAVFENEGHIRRKVREILVQCFTVFL